MYSDIHLQVLTTVHYWCSCETFKDNIRFSFLNGYCILEGPAAGKALSSRSIFSKCLRAFLMFTSVAAEANGGREGGREGEGKGGRKGERWMEEMVEKKGGRGEGRKGENSISKIAGTAKQHPNCH